MNENKLTDSDLNLALSLTMSPSKVDKYITLLKRDYGYNITKSELAEIINVSEQTIDRRIRECINIPNYHRTGKGSKASYIFPVIDVAEYLANTIKIL